MDKDRIIGAGKQVLGAAKQIVGRLIGDAKLQADGKTERSTASCRTRSAA